MNKRWAKRLSAGLAALMLWGVLPVQMTAQEATPSEGTPDGKPSASPTMIIVVPTPNAEDTPTPEETETP
ncbi:MAG: hypothetical protein Q4G52_11495, partial [Clostridia bacterium]|nr:hypothetical protein [Clostridia bacterium]